MEHAASRCTICVLVLTVALLAGGRSAAQVTTDTAQGFREMNQALKTRCEQH